MVVGLQMDGVWRIGGHQKLLIPSTRFVGFGCSGCLIKYRKHPQIMAPVPAESWTFQEPWVGWSGVVDIDGWCVGFGGWTD